MRVSRLNLVGGRDVDVDVSVESEVVEVEEEEVVDARWAPLLIKWEVN